jgi:hypothetical protein
MATAEAAPRTPGARPAAIGARGTAGDSQAISTSAGTDCVRTGGACGAGPEAVTFGGVGCGHGSGAQDIWTSTAAGGARGGGAAGAVPAGGLGLAAAGFGGAGSQPARISAGTD